METQIILYEQEEGGMKNEHCFNTQSANSDR